VPRKEFIIKGMLKLFKMLQKLRGDEIEVLQNQFLRYPWTSAFAHVSAMASKVCSAVSTAIASFYSLIQIVSERVSCGAIAWPADPAKDRGLVNFTDTAPLVSLRPTPTPPVNLHPNRP
jgi:hypothetical protein